MACDESFGSNVGRSLALSASMLRAPRRSLLANPKLGLNIIGTPARSNGAEHRHQQRQQDEEEEDDEQGQHIRPVKPRSRWQEEGAWQDGHVGPWPCGRRAVGGRAAVWGLACRAGGGYCACCMAESTGS